MQNSIIQKKVALCKEIKVFFKTISMSSVTGGAQASDFSYKNITIINLPMQMIFSMVDVIIN